VKGFKTEHLCKGGREEDCLGDMDIEGIGREGSGDDGNRGMLGVRERAKCKSPMSS
jgi:hypothetical protein